MACGLDSSAICSHSNSPDRPLRVTWGRGRSLDLLWAVVGLHSSPGHRAGLGGSGQPVTTVEQQGHTGPGATYFSNESRGPGPWVTRCPAFPGMDPILGTQSAGPQKTSLVGQSGSSSLWFPLVCSAGLSWPSLRERNPETIPTPPLLVLRGDHTGWGWAAFLPDSPNILASIMPLPGSEYHAVIFQKKPRPMPALTD